MLTVPASLGQPDEETADAEEPADGQVLPTAVMRSSARTLTFLAAVVTLPSEAVPWLRAVCRDLRLVRADFSSLICELNCAWASWLVLFTSVVMVLMSAETVFAVAAEGLRCAKLVTVFRSAATSAHSAEDCIPLPADAGADADAVTTGVADSLEEAAAGELEEELQETTASATGTASSPAFQGLMPLNRDDISLLRVGMALRMRAHRGAYFPENAFVSNS